MVNQVFLNGLDGRTVLLNTSTIQTVGQLRHQAADLSKTDPENIRLLSQTTELVDDSQLLSGAGVQDLGNVYVLGRLLGGGKKRKKKTYTKPKKIKHKKKKEKMATLKYYKVSDDMKIERLRRECPSETCGAGIFMAAHPDRFYCGKCTLTYVQEGKE